ncbi:MAG TPA: hypothetical protein VHO03_16680 [Ignavibacteriales bacterium]|nr:hypothetical protein [Ignavibacteriales bacterium]
MKTKGIICEEDPQQTIFSRKVKDWVDNKISYTELMDYYPDYDMPLPEKIFRKIRRYFRERRKLKLNGGGK